MQAGLEAFTRHSDAHDFAVHHCAVALEHLLKAYLAWLHPALIVEGRDFDSLLHATGHAQHAAVPVTRIKTIGLADALTRVERLLRPQITLDNKARAQMLAARNGVAHAGLHEPTEVEAVLTTCIRIVDRLLTVLGALTQNYWGHYRSLHDRLAEEHANSVRIQLETKLARARRAYRRRFEGVPPGEKTSIVMALTVRAPFSADREFPSKCPACGEQGWLGGTTDIDYASTTEIEGVGEVPTPMVVFFPVSFDCAVCRLALNGTEELELADLPVEVPLPEEDPDAYYDRREPDWDTYQPEPDEHDEREPDEDELRGR